MTVSGIDPTPERGARLHPLSPLLRGARVVVAVPVLLARNVASPHAGVESLIELAVLTPLVLLAGLVSWLVTRWRIADGDLLIDSGLLTRRHRRVPLSRLQSVDVVRPAAARIFGMAELRLEVAGASEGRARLAYLRDADAEALRGRLLALAHGLAEETPAPDERPLVRVPSRDLLISLLLGGPLLLTVLLVAAVIALAVTVPAAATGVLGAAVPLTLATGGIAVRRFLVEYGMAVADAGDGLRLRHGLLETRSQTVPRGRVQAIRVIRPFVWSLLPVSRSWCRVEVDVAGGAGRRARSRDGAQEKAATRALLPVAPRAVAAGVLTCVLDRFDLDAVDRALLTARPPRRARWRAPLAWHRLGVVVAPRHTATATGRLRAIVDIVPHGKVQSVRWVQGPVQRRLGLASVHLDTAGRDVHARALHRSDSDARHLVADLAELGRTARRESASRGAQPHDLR